MNKCITVLAALLTAFAVSGCGVRDDPDLKRLSRVGAELRALAGVIEQSGFTEATSDAETTGISWRGLICAVMPGEELPGHLTGQPWDSPKYAVLDQEELRGFFRLPGSTLVEPDQSGIQTFYGEGTFLAEVKESGWKAIASMPDDLLILISADPLGSHWMQPSPIDVVECWDRGATGKKLLPPPAHKSGRFLCFADGETWLVNGDTPDESILRFATVEGAGSFDRDTELSKYRLRRFRSPDWESRRVR